jgi:hypothetical protein
MTSTNAVAAKKAVIDHLTTALPEVQVAYSYPGRNPARELVHAGRVEGNHSFFAMKGTRARHAREEEATFRLHVVVEKPGFSPYDCELRCAEIGEEIEHALSATFTLDGIPGLLSVRVTAVDLDSADEDEGAVGVLTYDVTCRSVLT